ncbi:hypothetical protein BHE74_00057527, partial [Ensete ventricosum]
EQFYLWAPLVVIEDSAVSDLYVELVATFDLKRHTCSDLAIKKVICATRIDENGDGLLFKKSSNFHCLRVGVVGQRVHCVVDRLGLFLHGFIFGFNAFFRWVTVLILYWFNHEKSARFAKMFSAPCTGARMAVEGAEGFGMAGRGATLLSKASNLALIASSDAMVEASRSVMLRSFFCYRVRGMRIFGEEMAGWMAIVGIAWKGGGDRDDSKGNRNVAPMSNDRTPEGTL